MSAAANPDQGNFTLAEFIAWARIGKTVAYREIAAGRLVAMKCMSRTLIRREDAEAWRASLPRVVPKT